MGVSGWMFLLVPAHPDNGCVCLCVWDTGYHTVCVCVCVCVWLCVCGFRRCVLHWVDDRRDPQPCGSGWIGGCLWAGGAGCGSRFASAEQHRVRYNQCAEHGTSASKMDHPADRRLRPVRPWGTIPCDIWSGDIMLQTLSRWQLANDCKVKYTDTAVCSLNCHTATGTHMPYRITQCYLPPGRADIPALTPAEAGTRLSDPRGM